jgi:hypothetical protein
MNMVSSLQTPKESWNQFLVKLVWRFKSLARRADIARRTPCLDLLHHRPAPRAGMPLPVAHLEAVPASLLAVQVLLVGKAPLLDAILNVLAQGLPQRFDLVDGQTRDGTQRVDACLPQRVLDVDIPDLRHALLVEEKGLDRSPSPGQERPKLVQGQVPEVRPKLANRGVRSRVRGVVGIAKPPMVGGQWTKPVALTARLLI